jgi:hypothetical protein
LKVSDELIAIVPALGLPAGTNKKHQRKETIKSSFQIKQEKSNANESKVFFQNSNGGPLYFCKN